MSLAARRRAGAYWEPKIGAMTAAVLPGRHAVSDAAEEALTTLLGSCVAACLRDPEIGVGGMNHFLLPGDPGDGAQGERSMRYGVHAMEVLVNDILKRGGEKRRLEAKIFGGANVIDAGAGRTVGARNAAFVERYLEAEGIALKAADLGGDRARRVFYFPVTGRASVLKLAAHEAAPLRQTERALRARAAAHRSGGVELF